MNNPYFALAYDRDRRKTVFFGEDLEGSEAVRNPPKKTESDAQAPAGSSQA